MKEKITPLGMSQQNKSSSYEKPEFPGKQFPFRQQCLTLKKTLHTAPFIETSPNVLSFLNPEGPRDRQGSMPFSAHTTQQGARLKFP